MAKNTDTQKDEVKKPRAASKVKDAVAEKIKNKKAGGSDGCRKSKSQA